MLPGYCSVVKTPIRGGSNKWNGNEWNVALKADEYGINGIESCMKIACSPYQDCVGITWKNDERYCYVWNSCDFGNLKGGHPFISIKKNGRFISLFRLYKLLKSKRYS